MPDTETPTPDEFGRYRVAETVDGQTRHYSTRRFIPGAHRIVEGPDAKASFKNGQERPPKFPTEDDADAAQAEPSPQPETAPAETQQAPQEAPAPATADSTEATA